MTELSVNATDLQNATEKVAGLTDLADAPKALLLKLIDELKDAMDDLTEAPVSVVAAPEVVEEETVEPAEPIGTQFAGAFTPAASSHSVEIRLHKVHRA